MYNAVNVQQLSLCGGGNHGNDGSAVYIYNIIYVEEEKKKYNKIKYIEINIIKYTHGSILYGIYTFIIWRYNMLIHM